jgi:DNA-binding response OmpR family regulator
MADANTNPTAPVANTGAKVRVLLAEDDSFLSSMYVTKLQLSGFDVAHAENGERALDILKEGPKPDIMLLDIVMPKKSGFEVLEEMKKNSDWANIPVILLTNLSQKDDVDRGLSLGANDYLIKAHFTPSEVVSKIQKLLGK